MRERSRYVAWSCGLLLATAAAAMQSRARRRRRGGRHAGAADGGGGDGRSERRDDRARRGRGAPRGVEECGHRAGAARGRRALPPAGVARSRRRGTAPGGRHEVPGRPLPGQAPRGRQRPHRRPALGLALGERVGAAAPRPRGEDPRRRSRRLPLLGPQRRRRERALRPLRLRPRDRDRAERERGRRRGRERGGQLAAPLPRRAGGPRGHGVARLPRRADPVRPVPRPQDREVEAGRLPALHRLLHADPRGAGRPRGEQVRAPGERREERPPRVPAPGPEEARPEPLRQGRPRRARRRRLLEQPQPAAGARPLDGRREEPLVRAGVREPRVGDAPRAGHRRAGRRSARVEPPGPPGSPRPPRGRLRGPPLRRAPAGGDDLRHRGLPARGRQAGARRRAALVALPAQGARAGRAARLHRRGHRHRAAPHAARGRRPRPAARRSAPPDELPLRRRRAGRRGRLPGDHPPGAHAAQRPPGERRRGGDPGRRARRHPRAGRRRRGGHRGALPPDALAPAGAVRARALAGVRPRAA